MDTTAVEKVTMSKLIFTQDLNGERSWINSQFPGYRNLQTKHSGMWAGHSPTDPDEQNLFEVPCSDPVDCYNSVRSFDGAYKSIYSTDIGIDDVNWVCADNIVSNLNFSHPITESTHYQAVTFGRCGTVFTESLLRQRYKELAPHFAAASRDELQNNLISRISANKETAIALVYRNNWWEWITSTLIGHTHGYYHYDSVIDWSQLPSVELTDSFLKNSHHQVVSTWNLFCNLRVLFSDRLFYLLELSDTSSKHAKNTSHKKINYDKRQLISNFDSAEKKFKNTYLEEWTTMTNRCTQHLVSMGCKTDITLDK